MARLVREWRSTHSCPEKAPEASETQDQFFSSAASQVEQAPIGFAPTMLPGRHDWAIEDE